MKSGWLPGCERRASGRALLLSLFLPSGAQAQSAEIWVNTRIASAQGRWIS